jgi:ribose 5-phosphate isomerase B
VRIAIGNDHVAYAMKTEIAAHLRGLGHEVVDLGHGDETRTDYPTYGAAVGRAVASGDVDRGIAICGTGVGISIAANKIPGVRAVCCSEPYSARLSREHNDTNVLCFGARVVGIELATMIVDCWLEGAFEGGRHARRVAMLTDLDGAGPATGA